MMPKDSKYGEWARSGEIDIMEGRGNQDLGGSNQIGVEQYGVTLHFANMGSNTNWQKAHFSHQEPKGLNAAFHIYKMEWTPGKGVDI